MTIYISEFDIQNVHHVLASTNKGVMYFANDDNKDDLLRRIQRYLKDETLIYGQAAYDFNEKYIKDIHLYYNKQLTIFDWTFDLYGTAFQKSVWQALIQVPFGKTSTYGEIANEIQNPKAVRAVGGAIGENPVFIAIPCHRIIGKNGKLTGFRGGLAMKRTLLDIESILYTD
ncbi:methylated-DNA--[protein]-cysteine S-methyltransferase [Macrococcus sp. DPC7161]|uniref:methylated-DNA--[protein]-cysteine S-methyltransferase n=1 Tax=Macrococcus sp. DPC7161 TaxID=2507060 RepID=UPI00100C2437|nr:methylated-DNA--[protein]-cysteine S-methyltransferase [Macrococcus sp. DPC7161]RXK17921.1 methylated-DNA--[protein]-cysteine S-methyltransferase [Macrococcus sp. DPC7161]